MKGKIVPLMLILSYFLPHINKYKKTFYACFVGYGIAYVLGGIIKPLFYRDIINVITSVEENASVAKEIISLVITIGIIILVQNIIHRCTDYAMVYSQSKILRELNNYSFAKLQNHSYQFFVNNFQGSLVAKSRRFVRSFEALHDNMVFAFWQALLQLVGIFVVLFISAPVLGLFFALWSLFFIGLTVYLVQKKRKYDLEVAVADSKTTGGLADAITGALNIKAFASLAREKKIFADITDKEEKVRRFAWNFNNIIMIVHSVVWFILEAGGLYLVVKLWINSSVSGGTIVLAQTYFFTINGIMWNLRSAITSSMRAVSDASEMIEIFERKPDILDSAYPEPCRINEGEIVFDDATFAYGEDSPVVFKGFNLTVKPKEKVGLVGYSGVGKTTMTKLLLRFVELSSGKITIDGQNIANLRQNDLRSNIAYVPQDPILFHRSLGENIAYSKPEATHEEIVKAAVAAHAHEFISNFFRGYETLVGERGVKLSGGERQRIAIARAILADTPILILDEATSSLDSVSENLVQEALGNLMKNRTTIVIAHRLSTIQKMDRIVVLDSNGIIEEGSHHELLLKRGTYYNFWDHQSGGFIS